MLRSAYGMSRPSVVCNVAPNKWLHRTHRVELFGNIFAPPIIIAQRLGQFILNFWVNNSKRFYGIVQVKYNGVWKNMRFRLISRFVSQGAQLSQRSRDLSCYWIFCCHPRALKVIQNDCWVGRKSLLVFHCNYVSRTVSEIFSAKEWRDLETRVRDRSRSLKIAPFGISYTTEKHDDDDDFLLVGHCKYSSMLYHFRVIWRSIIVALIKVTEGHSNWYHSKALVRFPILLP